MKVLATSAAPDRKQEAPGLTREDFQSDQIVRWCPGCGDYAILATMQRTLPELGVPREQIVFVSGIGCSSRFPYYMETYGIHTIHGRAPTIATGLKMTRRDLFVWVITGDGDGLSIGGNHLIHACRRNVDINILLFNNQIYGLTKGQHSPTSPVGQKTYSTPEGSIDAPFNPLRVAIGANASLIARSIDRDTHHLQQVIKRAHEHRGTTFIEVYQDCLVYNKGAFATMTDKKAKDDHVLYLEHGMPMIFGKDRDKGIRLDGYDAKVVSLKEERYSTADILVHDEQDPHGILANILATFQERPGYPRPVGIIRAVERPCYEDQMEDQIDAIVAKLGHPDLQSLFEEGDTWGVSAKEYEDSLAEMHEPVGAK